MFLAGTISLLGFAKAKHIKFEKIRERSFTSAEAYAQKGKRTGGEVSDTHHIKWLHTIQLRLVT